jgi:hypothetical protein
MKEMVRITHRPTGTLLAEGPVGWGITPFEGNYYIGRRYRKGGTFKPNFVPGLCVYKFLYVGMDLLIPNGTQGNRVAEEGIAWMYWLPNPLFPFIWFRVALPGDHPHLSVERFKRELQ